MRNLTTVSAWTRTSGEFIALADDGTLWLGKLVSLGESNTTVVEWKPLNGPPDGDFWNKMKSFWDRMEETIRREAEIKDRTAGR